MYRLSPFAFIGVLFLAYVWSERPEQFLVTMNKTGTIMFSVWLGYMADYVTSWYARPNKLSESASMSGSDLVVSASMIRRAIIMAAVIYAYARAI